MRNVSLLATALVVAGCTGAASAADLAARTYTKAPVAAAVYDWTGGYVGLNAGAGWADSSVSTSNSAGTPGIFGSAGNRAAVSAAGTGGLGTNASFVGGGQIGYNWQLGRNVLVGIEGDIDSFSHRADLTNVATTTLGALTVSSSVRTEWLATLRGRLGFTVDRTLLYVTGGAAFTEQKLTQTPSGTLAVSGAVAGSGTVSSTKAGWTVGAGVEQAVWGNWSIKAEYLFARFDGLNAAYTATAASGSTQNVTISTDHMDVQTARVGINYRFGGPVIAKY